jgi:hypothetical protein
MNNIWQLESGEFSHCNKWALQYIIFIEALYQDTWEVVGEREDYYLFSSPYVCINCGLSVKLTSLLITSWPNWGIKEAAIELHLK